MGEAVRSFYEFFAGGGMARAGLGSGWRCVFANDFDPMKTGTYLENWGADHIVFGDVAKLTTDDLPGIADLAWASFPCQDLSLAGDRAGMGPSTAATTTRSGTFWPFWALIRGLRQENRAPTTIVLENVYGALTSHRGKDFAAICSAMAGAGYRFGAMVLDAIDFVPQSRPRLFFVAVKKSLALSPDLINGAPSPRWHPRALVSAYSGLPSAAKRGWVWWQLPIPAARTSSLSELIDDEPCGIGWHDLEATARLLQMMSPRNRAKVEAAGRTGRRMVGGVYKRTRPDAEGAKVQRAEVRFDDVAGCLRTPAGGSSRQVILVVTGESVRSRLLSPREAARLMGLDDSYRLPPRYNDAYRVAGDGVCPPVVRYIAANLLEPVLTSNEPPLLRLMRAA